MQNGLGSMLVVADQISRWLFGVVVVGGSIPVDLELNGSRPIVKLRASTSHLPQSKLHCTNPLSPHPTSTKDVESRGSV